MELQTSDQVIAYLLIVGFTGPLKLWRDQHLLEREQDQIIHASKLDEQGDPLTDENSEEIEDDANSLHLPLLSHFIGDPLNIKGKNQTLLPNLRCIKSSDNK